MSRYDITTYLIEQCQKLHPGLSILELLDYYREKSKDVPLIDVDEARIAFAMREEAYGQGYYMGEQGFNMEIYLDQPLSEKDPCRKCGRKTNRDTYGKHCEDCI